MSKKDVQTAANFPPDEISLSMLRAEAADCRECDLWKNATQTVFGEGKERARLVMIGEQPGDQEDLAGHPFVGPAGQLLDRALKEAGIDREQVYVTNAVKHFKWTPRGKRRIHEKPRASEIAACHPWLIGELEVIQPLAVVCLGATAAQSLLSRDFRVTRDRGKWIEAPPYPMILATVHPSSILRARSGPEREEQFAAFVNDLKVAAKILA